MFDQAIDIRHQLARNPNAGPNERTPLSQKTGLVLHYNGPPVPASRDDLEFLQFVAGFHRDRDWRANPNVGSPIRGNGIMYHLGVGRDGKLYWMRDLEETRWHCGSWPENQTYIAVFVILGGNQRMTPAQERTVRVVCDEWINSNDRRPRSQVVGHQELSWTDCPGTIQEWIYEYRTEVEVTVDGKWFEQTRCYIGGAFWEHWRSNGGLMTFGYPLTNEIDEDGRTVQYFERAVFEWHPDNDRPYRVLLRRLGAEALKQKNAA